MLSSSRADSSLYVSQAMPSMASHTIVPAAPSVHSRTPSLERSLSLTASARSHSRGSSRGASITSYTSGASNGSRQSRMGVRRGRASSGREWRATDPPCSRERVARKQKLRSRDASGWDTQSQHRMTSIPKCSQRSERRPASSSFNDTYVRMPAVAQSQRSGMPAKTRAASHARPNPCRAAYAPFSSVPSSPALEKLPSQASPLPNAEVGFAPLPAAQKTLSEGATRRCCEHTPQTLTLSDPGSVAVPNVGRTRVRPCSTTPLPISSAPGGRSPLSLSALTGSHPVTGREDATGPLGVLNTAEGPEFLDSFDSSTCASIVTAEVLWSAGDAGGAEEGCRTSSLVFDVSTSSATGGTAKAGVSSSDTYTPSVSLNSASSSSPLAGRGSIAMSEAARQFIAAVAHRSATAVSEASVLKDTPRTILDTTDHDGTPVDDEAMRIYESDVAPTVCSESVADPPALRQTFGPLAVPLDELCSPRDAQPAATPPVDTAFASSSAVGPFSSPMIACKQEMARRFSVWSCETAATTASPQRVTATATQEGSQPNASFASSGLEGASLVREDSSQSFHSPPSQEASAAHEGFAATLRKLVQAAASRHSPPLPPPTPRGDAVETSFGSSSSTAGVCALDGEAWKVLCTPCDLPAAGQGYPPLLSSISASLAALPVPPSDLLCALHGDAAQTKGVAPHPLAPVMSMEHCDKVLPTPHSIAHSRPIPRTQNAWTSAATPDLPLTVPTAGGADSSTSRSCGVSSSGEGDARSTSTAANVPPRLLGPVSVFGDQRPPMAQEDLNPLGSALSTCHERVDSCSTDSSVSMLPGPRTVRQAIMDLSLIMQDVSPPVAVRPVGHNVVLPDGCIVAGTANLGANIAEETPCSPDNAAPCRAYAPLALPMDSETAAVSLVGEVPLTPLPVRTLSDH